MAPPTTYLAVLKAAYDYTPDSEDEIAIKEDQILLLIERIDDDWWRVKAKDADEADEGGLVPAAYVEPAPHKSLVKALYDYDASAPGELSIKEDDALLAFDVDDGWLLVQTERDGGKAGFVPENYVETTDVEAAEEPEYEEEQEVVAVPAAPAIVVPPSPPRPSAPYVDPAERVAATTAKAPTDHIKTWSVSEVDKKGKKKKGTLGIGNGAIFFASESDKTPVQKWSIGDVDASYMEKNKHVYIEILGDTPVNLHFNTGSRDYAEEIIEKLDKSKAAAKASAGSPVDQEAPVANGSPKPKKNGVSVHFATTPPLIISPREPEGDSEPEDYINTREERVKGDGNEWVTVLYDFNADGDDELSVREGDRLVVLEKDGDEWWKVRDNLGHEGVVPASYVELEKSGLATNGNGKANAYSDEEADRLAAEREQEERDQARQEAERKRADAERKAKLIAEAAEAERKRKEREREKKMKEEEEKRRRDEEGEEELKRASRYARPASASGSRSRPSEDRGTASPPRDHKARPSSDKTRGTPAPQRVRTWHDRTGQFKVDAEFLGFSNGKLRLHKTNGVVIEVPAEKMSTEDMKFIERLKAGKDKDKSQSSRTLSPEGSDDEPLAVRRRSLQPEPKAKPVPPKKGKSIDWFEFFLNAGCDLDDCTRYAASFERDKIDEEVLPDITQQTMRSLGLREGDIIRVTKAIAQRTPGGMTSALEEQMKRDEELARALQDEESGGKSVPKRQATSPGLFAGPGGVLKNNTRRGRPQPSKSLPPASVDLQSIATASEQITRLDSPSTSRVMSPSSAVSGPPRASSAAPIVSGFDDDAWVNRPSSTQPSSAQPPAAASLSVTARAPSAPPAQSQPTITQSPPAVPALPPAPATATSTGSSLARTTESDVFEQLARLSAMKMQSPAKNAPASASAPPSAISPPVITPPAGFQNGMGMGSSPVPLGHFQTQVSGLSPQNIPRGPFAPVPANQGLLQPLVPTTTGFNSFIPTRPSSNPPPPSFTSPSPQPSFLNSQLTGYPGAMASQPAGFAPPVNMLPMGFSGSLNPQPTGFTGGMQPQQTGFPNSGPLMAQTTSYPGAFGAGPFTGGRAFGPQQPNVTGFNPGFGQASSPPPVPPLPTNNAVNNTAPANVFAQMKSGTFANDSAPQPTNKYDALRPQPTGWGMQNGYSGPFY